MDIMEKWIELHWLMIRFNNGANLWVLIPQSWYILGSFNDVISTAEITYCRTINNRYVLRQF